MTAFSPLSLSQYSDDGALSLHIWAFPHLLYPLQNVAMVASIYTTVVVSLGKDPLCTIH